ncbi:MAG: serine hydrolase [Bacteroidetes bacterium]|nr:serine hydrolase [Bacteroidota bacterium]MBS1631876.1 serine hydrolase [Bacteroidota bacterium]
MVCRRERRQRRVKYVLTIVFLFICFTVFSQTRIPSYYKQSKRFNKELKKIVHVVGLDSTYDAGEDGMETISFAVIDLTKKKPLFGGVHADNFIYPASVYKMYVAMEILKQVSNGEYSLFTPYIVHSPNDVDKGKEIDYDPRPLLKDGDTVTINYLLDLMITRSDNSAANCLIDVARRPRINQTMHENNWNGSEVTRKFLSRKFEDPGYDSIKSTETCALHAADFMYKIYSEQLVTPWVSRQLKVLLGRQLDTTKLSTGLPATAMFYHKTGWWSIYTNDVGIVEEARTNGLAGQRKIKYIISVFTPIAEEKVRPRLKELSKRVHDLIINRENY